MFDWKFYIFLYPELIKKYKISNKNNAYEHWINIGRYEGKIGYHIDKNIFNWKNYLKNNSFLIKEGIKDKRKAILHWYNIGKNLGLQISKHINNENDNIRDLIKYENNYNDIENLKENDKKFIKLIVDNNINLKDYSINNNNEVLSNILDKSITKDLKISKNIRNNPIITTNKKLIKESIEENKNNLLINHNNKLEIKKDKLLTNKDNDSKFNTLKSETNLLNIVNVQKKINPKIYYFEKINNSERINNIKQIDNDKTNNSERINDIKQIDNDKTNNSERINDIKQIDNDKTSNIEIYENSENISKLINVNILIKYYYDDINFLLNVFNYYRNYINIIILIENIEDYIINIGNFYNIKVYSINEYNNFVLKKSDITFIGELYNNIVIDKNFLKNNQENKIYKKIKSGKCNYLSPIEFLNNIDNYKKIDENDIFIELYFENIFNNINLQHKECIRSKFFKKEIINDTIDDNYSKENYLYNLVDNIYLLNLFRRIDRYNNSVERLKNIEIYNFEQFYGIDGNNKIINILYNYYYSKLLLFLKGKNLGYKKSIPSSGSLAILFSMKNMLFDAIRQEYSKILVLQDDIFFIDNFYDRLQEQLKIIKDIKWKLLYLGANDRNLKNKSNEDLIKIKKNKYYFAEGNIDGAFGVIIDNSIFTELIEEIDKFNLPFDSGPLKTIQKKYIKECIVLYPNLIIADVTESDCRHSRNQQIFSKDLLWNLEDYKLIYCNKNNYSKLTLIIYDKSNKFMQDIFNKINTLYNNCIFNNFNINIIILTILTNNNKINNNISIIKIDNINDDFYNINLGICISSTKYIKIILLDNFSEDFRINFIKNKDFIEQNYSLYYEKNSMDIYDYIFLKYDYFYNDCNNLQEKYNKLKNIDNKLFVSYSENNLNNINII